MDGRIVVTPIPIPAMNLEAYRPDRFPLLNACPNTPAMYTTVKIWKTNRRPSIEVSLIQEMQPNTALAVAIETIQPLVLAYSSVDWLVRLNLFLKTSMTTSDAMFPIHWLVERRSLVG